MSALELPLLSLGRFLRSHWAGFSQLEYAKQTPVPAPGFARDASLAPLVPALGPSPRPWSQCFDRIKQNTLNSSVQTNLIDADDCVLAGSCCQLSKNVSVAYSVVIGLLSIVVKFRVM